jgi:hypothetical protein
VTRYGADPALRVKRAAGLLKSDATYLEHACAEEGIEVPAEVLRALAEVRQWARSLGAADPAPTSRIQAEVAIIPARPRRRDGWKYRL